MPVKAVENWEMHFIIIVLMVIFRLKQKNKFK